MTLTRADVLRLLGQHGLRPSRALGQNFVTDPNTVRRIARLAGVSDASRVVEIGAGLGSLTLALAETGARVLAVEIDPRLVPILRDVVGAPAGADPGSAPVTVLEGDARALNWEEVLSAASAASAASAGSPGPEGSLNQPWELVANLPYNVATPLVLDLLQEAPRIGSMLVMVQREVGERLAATVGSPAYGAVSVKVAYWATASVVGRVPPTVFVPRPKVESVLVRIVRRAEPAVSPEQVTAERLFDVVRAGFAHRRKMLRRSLAGTVDPAAFEAAGVSPEARAEELTVVDWGRLARWR